MGAPELQPFLGSWRMVPDAPGSRPPFQSATYTLAIEPQGLRVQASYVHWNGPGTLSYLAIPEAGSEPASQRDLKTFRVIAPSVLELKNWLRGRYNGLARWTLLEGGATVRVVWANSEVVPGSPDQVAVFERTTPEQGP
jgi:hypothetical protein